MKGCDEQGMGGVNVKNEPVLFLVSSTPQVPAHETPIRSVSWWQQVRCWISRITGWFR